jgi:uncharacterized Zn ribbon protein
MPLTQSKDYRPNSQPELTEEERKAQEKARRKFALALEDMADEGDAVLITVLKDIGIKDFGNGSAQGYLIRFIALTGDHEGLVNDEWPVYKRGFLNRIEKAGVGASFVSRLGRYGERKTIGLEDNLQFGWTVDHRCHTRRCIRLDHLRLLPNEANAQRNRPGLDWDLDGSCANGHGPEHRYVIRHIDQRRKTRCRRCMADANERWQRKKQLTA